MIVSPLATITIISPNKSVRNQKKYFCAIDTINIHVMDGNLTVEACGNGFKNPSRQASTNYGIDSKGRIGCYVPEDYRSWASGNKPNDYRAITIEMANDGPKSTGYHVSDVALNALVELLVDVCKRNGIKKLVWSTNKDDRINHKNGCNMTLHRDYSKKACPGDYLVSKHPWIAEQVNTRLGVTNTKPKTPTTPSTSTTTPSLYKYNNVDMSPVFDSTFYANKYPDLKAALGTNSTLLFNHFINYGMKEARQAIATFDPVRYKNHYPDLQKAFGDIWSSYYIHYCTNGIKEGRSGI